MTKKLLLKILNEKMMWALLLAVLVLAFAFPTMWCWNYLMPDLFGIKEITFTQAVVLNVLSNVIFKSTSSNPK